MVPVSRTLRIAVVGLGGISQSVHLPLLRRRWDLFEVVALVDLSASRTEAMSARFGVAADAGFRTVDDLLAAREAGLVEVDGVVLATTGSHGPEVRRLVAAGVPVLSEKPLALSLAELDALGQDADRGGWDLGARVMVGYMKEYDPATARAREELAGKVLRAVTVEVLHPADGAQLGFARLAPPPDDVDPDVLGALQARNAGALDDAVGAGLPTHLRTLFANVVLGSLVHDISLLRHLGGGVATVEQAVHWGPAVPGSVEVAGTVVGGARLHVGWHFIADYPDYRETVTFHHESGSVQLVFGVPYLLNSPTELTVVSRARSTDRSGATGEVRATYRWNQEEAFENELVAFHELVTRGTPGSSGVPQARADLLVAQRILAALVHRDGAEVAGEAAR